MENIIFNELVNRDLNVDVGLVNVVTKRIKTVIRYANSLRLILSATRVQSVIMCSRLLQYPTVRKMAQESNSLLRIDDSFKKIIVVKDTPAPWYTEKGILVIGIYDFLLRADSLDI